MLRKILSVSVLMMALPLLSSAQDKIYKNDGSVIEAKIQNVSPRSITYVRYDNQSGTEYIIHKNLVEKVVYQNGTQEVMDGSDKSTKGGGRIHYRPNLLTIAPVQFSENGLGGSLSYERSLDPKGLVSFYIPVIVTSNMNSDTHYNPTTGRYENGHQDVMAYFMPGVKIYPTGCHGIVRYAIGPSIAFGTGQKSRTIIDPYTGYDTYKTDSKMMLGMVINNSLNINPSPRLYVGLEIGLGFTYLHRVDGLNQGTTGFAQGGFKIGYRF